MIACLPRATKVDMYQSLVSKLLDKFWDAEKGSTTPSGF